MKKFGGIIKNWQTHTLSTDIETARKTRPELKEDKVMVFTGTVVEDPTGRFQPGWHMRSSVIVHLDRENGVCETLNTIYHLEGEEGGDVFDDMGKGVLSIFY